jgi:release factor glutamine methyltransferase
MNEDMRLDECLQQAVAQLVAAGIQSPRRESRLLLGHWLGRDPAAFLGVQAECIDNPKFYFDLVKRRVNREPMSHLLGYREFWSLSFDVTSSVLDPRPDSEALVESVLKEFPREEEKIRILDFGTGTGCLILSVLSERPQAIGVGVDVSKDALKIANGNAKKLSFAARVAFLESDWGENLSGSFDCILANPPYLASEDIDGLAPEVAQFEPRLALDGGIDGLDCYRALSKDVKRLLAPGGKAFFEIGEGQASEIEDILEATNLRVVRSFADLGARIRCLIAQAY